MSFCQVARGWVDDEKSVDGRRVQYCAGALRGVGGRNVWMRRSIDGLARVWERSTLDPEFKNGKILCLLHFIVP
jgi:hypothetical protein